MQCSLAIHAPCGQRMYLKHERLPPQQPRYPRPFFVNFPLASTLSCRSSHPRQPALTTITGHVCHYTSVRPASSSRPAPASFPATATATATAVSLAAISTLSTSAPPLALLHSLTAPIRFAARQALRVFVCLFVCARAFVRASVCVCVCVCV